MAKNMRTAFSQQKTLIAFSGVALLLLFLCSSCVGSTTILGDTDPIPTIAPLAGPIQDDKAESTAISSTTAILTATATHPPGQEATVHHIVDGDTIEILIDGAEHSVRYIGIDTPERGMPFFNEATAANAALVEGQTVLLVKDVSETDRYGRLLRYVYLPDGTHVNAELVRNGFAQIATFPPDVANQSYFQMLEEEARTAGLGLWASIAEASPTAASSHIVITAVDKREEYVDIHNQGDQPQDLTGWNLISEKGSQECPLGGVIDPNETLRIWAMSADASRDGYNCGHGKTIWSNSESDPAVLIDDQGQPVSRWP